MWSRGHVTWYPGNSGVIARGNSMEVHVVRSRGDGNFPYTQLGITVQRSHRAPFQMINRTPEKAILSADLRIEKLNN